MVRSRVLVIGLDGLEPTLAERLMDAGEMPALAELRRRSARFRLDHGPAQRTGLAWEHVASGLSPDEGRRWAAVEFDPATYRAWQEGARFTPWWDRLEKRVVVFDAPYVDLRRAPKTRGIVGWGAHDPGVSTSARPAKLLGEFEGRFGPYPAAPWTYGVPWASPSRSRTMGEALSHALSVRSSAARWLATERLPDWDLFLAVEGEAHGAVEGLWHGLDPGHPLHRHASAEAAGEALTEVHRGVDRMVAELSSAAPDATIVAFTMGGMGPNHSDVPSMLLLSELLYRRAFGRPLLQVPPEWAAAPAAFPPLGDSEDWSHASFQWVPMPARAPAASASERWRGIGRRLPRPVRDAFRRTRDVLAGDGSRRRGPVRLDLAWQPAARYQPYWSRMPAFALPSFYDGRIRVNLKGRERCGMVAPSDFEPFCRELETMLRECRNPRTGEPAVEEIERASTKDPMALNRSEADLLVIWRGVSCAIEHPRLGLIGPVPLRRTGGHTGRYGMAYVQAPGLEPGDRGVRSAFDVVPTLASLLGDGSPAARAKSLLS
jgi:predicted AlkP superfamily phosphohydrolase/phosphomutase